MKIAMSVVMKGNWMATLDLIQCIEDGNGFVCNTSSFDGPSE